MVTNRLLAADDLSSLYDCFLEAFSDYQVDMRMSPEQFAQRLTRDGVQLEISAATFDHDRMIGFYMNGLGDWQGKLTAYDAGTGVVPVFRKRGVARELFEFLTPRLKAASVSQYLLEVLSSNEPAIELYRRLGFVETRRLAVLRAKDNPKSISDLKGVSIRSVERANWELFQSFWDGYPSWQNSIPAVERIAAETVIVGAYDDDRCLGYGVVFKPSANLMQLAVATGQRRKGIGSVILAALQREVAEALKVNNVDKELRGTLAFYEALGFREVLTQFEMMKTL